MASRATRAKVDVAKMSRQCVSGKIGYLTRDEALDGAERGMAAGKVSPGCHLTPYECDDCRFWHIRNRRIVFDLPPDDAGKRDYRKRTGRAE